MAETSSVKTRVRSPGFPFIGLRKAIDRARQFYDQDKRNWANMKVAVKHWDFNEASSGGKQTVAALVAYGLLESTGTGDERQLRLSEDAVNIILDERDPSEERDRLIRRAAVRPKLHKELWDRYEKDLPSNENLRDYLVREHRPHFNVKWVDHFIGEFRATLAFAKFDESDTISEGPEDAQEGPRSQDQMQNAAQVDQHKPTGETPPPSTDSPYLTFPLPRGNAIEIRLRSKVSASEFDRLKQLFELMRDSVVEE